MNNWLLLFVLISFIVYIPSFNASGSYSSSSPGGRRRSGRGGQTGSGYGGSDGKGRLTGSLKGTDVDDTRKGSKGGPAGGSGSGGSDAKLDTDYRDIIEYISKEIDNGKGSDYSRSGASYSRRRDDDIGAPRDGGSDASYPRGRNDDYRNGADGGYPAYVPPSYIPYPVPGYSSGGGNKGALSSGLLLQLTDSIQEQYGSITALQHKAEQCKEDLAELKATQYHLIGNIITLTESLKQLIKSTSIIIPPSIGVNRAICVGYPDQPEGMSGTVGGSSTDSDLSCPPGSTAFVGPDGKNDIGDHDTIVKEFGFKNITQCQEFCVERGCKSYNWFVTTTGFSCELYSKDVPIFKQSPETGFMPEATIFCILDKCPCVIGEIITYAGSAETLPVYLKPADGSQIDNDDFPASNRPICDILNTIYGVDDDHDDGTCLLPDLNGKFLLTSGDGRSSDCEGISVDQGECVGSNILDFTGEEYEFPKFPKPQPRPI